jgi:hypothetical protein
MLIYKANSVSEYVFIFNEVTTDEDKETLRRGRRAGDSGLVGLDSGSFPWNRNRDVGTEVGEGRAGAGYVGDDQEDGADRVRKRAGDYLGSKCAEILTQQQFPLREKSFRCFQKSEISIIP